MMLSITVNTLDDVTDGNINDGTVSLRDAIAAATAGETINFSVHGTIALAYGQLLIDKDLTINGPGANLLTIDAHGNSRVFDIDDDDSENLIDVRINGLTLTGGQTAAEESGGAISSTEDLTLLNSVVTGNSSDHLGGGIASFEGLLSITSCTISGNHASVMGGGVYSDGNQLTISESTISGNSAGGYGGGIFTYGGNNLLTDSTVSGNSTNGIGGGIASSNTSYFTIIQSTISGNSAGDRGGGIYSNHSLTVRNSTISGNTADDGGGGISANLNNQSSSFRIEFDHIIVAGNTDDSGAAPDLETRSAFQSERLSIRFSLVGDNTGSGLSAAPVGSPDANGNLIGDPHIGGVIDALLGPLADNGGPTQTLALLAGSPAIDAGDPLFSSVENALFYDQRGVGFLRVRDGRIDIGAFESQPSEPTPTETVLANSDTSIPVVEPPPPIVPPLVFTPPKPPLLLIIQPVVPLLVSITNHGGSGWLPRRQTFSVSGVPQAVDAVFGNDRLDQNALLAGFLDSVDPENLVVELGDEPPGQIASAASKVAASHAAARTGATPPITTSGTAQASNGPIADVRMKPVDLSEDSSSADVASPAITAKIMKNWKWFASGAAFLLLGGAAWKSRYKWMQAARKLRSR